MTMTSCCRASPTCRRRARPRGGFSLIELMIVLVIAAILGAIAMPLYLHQIRESRRTDARSALTDLAAREERYYAINSTYTAVANQLGYAAWPQVVGGGYYQIIAPSQVTAGTANSAPTFTVTAVPVAGQGQDLDTDCASFSVSSTGQQTSLNSAGADSTAICWH
jgi:type IV pilus assembly protein PilE